MARHYIIIMILRPKSQLVECLMLKAVLLLGGTGEWFGGINGDLLRYVLLESAR